MTPSPPAWDPHQYLRHGDHRVRPLHDLLARVPGLPGEPAPRIADLGCGPGGPSLPLLRRWPAAHLTGYDNSSAMLAEAAQCAGRTPEGGVLDFVPADLTAWQPEDRFDLLFSNAALQWLPGHTRAFPGWVEGLKPGGVLALQVPGNFGAPSHVLLAELCSGPRWRGRLGDLVRGGTPVPGPAGYFAELAALGCEVDTWETTYLHLLTGEDPVLDWLKGTALRPILTALADDPAACDAFLADFAGLLRTAYPATPHGTPFPFRRIFAVAVKR
jgi:trans-aconitate 2-methyltransferase